MALTFTRSIGDVTPRHGALTLQGQVTSSLSVVGEVTIATGVWIFDAVRGDSDL